MRLCVTRFSVTRFGVLTLGVACFALALAGPAAAQEGAPAPDAPDTAALNPLSSLDKSALGGFRDMPLFTPSRRRPEPPEVVEAAPPPPPAARVSAPEPAPELKLAGVVEGPEGSVAVVENDGRMERLRLGDQVAGWLVTTIDPAALKLTLDEREQEYRMFQRTGDSEAAGEGEAGDDEDETAQNPAMRRTPPPKARGANAPGSGYPDADEER